MGSFASSSRRELASLAAGRRRSRSRAAALAWRINLLALPEDEARALGVNTRRLRARRHRGGDARHVRQRRRVGHHRLGGTRRAAHGALVVGPEFSRLLPVRALFGAMFMLLIDTVARTLAIIEVPPGILTAVVGTPVFIALLARARRMF